MSEYEVEIMHRVYDNREGVCIEVRPDTDIPDCLMIWTPDKESKAFYGDFRLSMSIDHAQNLHEALGRQIQAMRAGSA